MSSPTSAKRELARRELVGVALLLLSLFLATALVFGHAMPGARASCSATPGPFGPVGECMRQGLFLLLGVPAAALLPLAPAVHSLRLFGRMRSDTDRSWMLFLGGMVLLLPVALDLGRGAHASEATASALSGVWGGLMAHALMRPLGTAGAWFVLAFAFSALAVLTLAWNPVRALVAPRPKPLPVGAPGAAVADVAAEGAAPVKRRRKKSESDGEGVSPLEPPPEEFPSLSVDQTAIEPVVADAADGKGRRRKKEAKGDDSFVAPEPMGAAADGDGALPPTSLLTEPPPKNHDVNRRELEALGARLMDALRTFKVQGELTGWTTGPVVTQFEVEPAPGVKVRQIANLANDLALAMRAQSIRIVAPIPGRGAVGVEVPNPTPEMVHFRDLLESPEFQHARAGLPIALGRNLEGRPVIADLAKMPHLLIAGATGSGKSVCVNTIITSLVYRHTRKQLRFLMVDPKMVELSVYNTLPHLRHKVITDNKDAAKVLKWAVAEMQERYELLAANGCRNIQDFNRRLESGATLANPKRDEVAFEDLTYRGGILPYIVVVIDELADLMMTVQGEVETPLAMLAQKARAIGIHLILATQRPSVNVITGLIKANFPSRIAFRVASQVDSRTIIDGAGAEALLGNGDMLFIPPGKSEPARLQGAFISSEDTDKLMRWYEAQRERQRAEGLIPEEAAGQEEPDILQKIRELEAQEKAGANGDERASADGDRDELFREAAELFIQHQQASTSLLQRRLNVGYGRAARIIDQLHEAGVLGESKGARGRDVLVGLDELDRICPR